MAPKLVFFNGFSICWHRVKVQLYRRKSINDNFSRRISWEWFCFCDAITAQEAGKQILRSTSAYMYTNTLNSQPPLMHLTWHPGQYRAHPSQNGRRAASQCSPQQPSAECSTLAPQTPAQPDPVVLLRSQAQPRGLLRLGGGRRTHSQHDHVLSHHPETFQVSRIEERLG